MEARTPSSIRLSETERMLLQAAARRSGKGWTTFVREVALWGAVSRLEHEIPDLRPSESDDGETIH